MLFSKAKIPSKVWFEVIKVYNHEMIGISKKLSLRLIDWRDWKKKAKKKMTLKRMAQKFFFC